MRRKRVTISDTRAKILLAVDFPVLQWDTKNARFETTSRTWRVSSYLFPRGLDRVRASGHLVPEVRIGANTPASTGGRVIGDIQSSRPPRDEATVEKEEGGSRRDTARHAARVPEKSRPLDQVETFGEAFQPLYFSRALLFWSRLRNIYVAARCVYTKLPVAIVSARAVARRDRFFSTSYLRRCTMRRKFVVVLLRIFSLFNGRFRKATRFAGERPSLLLL